MTETSLPSPRWGWAGLALERALDDIGGMERERVIIYTTDYCGYCRRAKQLLTERSIGFAEIDVTDDPEQRAWLEEKTGRRTVPQIFIDGEPIGGYDSLVALARAGKLI